MNKIDVNASLRSLVLILACATVVIACGGKGSNKAPDGGARDDGSVSSADLGADRAGSPDGTNDTTGGAGGTGGPGGAPGDARADQPNGNPDASTGMGGSGGADGGPVDHPIDTNNGCPVDCNHLPHVLAGVSIPCVNGECAVSTAYCEANYAHCRGSGNAGCESSLTTLTDCGFCNYSCFGSNIECRDVGNYYRCAQPCTTPQPDACGFLCSDFQTDSFNCGSCGHQCSQPNQASVCQAGVCVKGQCADGFADCEAGDDGCETQLGNDTNCSACGDPSCQLANTLFTCSAGAAVCDAALCVPGFANCNLTSPDCEAPFTGTASCLPTYIDTKPLATGDIDFAATAIGPDGSVFIGGDWMGAVDFDPSSGKDIRTAIDQDSFVTKFNPDGSYAWTATLTGRGSSSVGGLAATPTGAVVVTGSYGDTLILDPSGATPPRQTATVDQIDPYFAELTAAGKIAWGGSFQGDPGAGAFSSQVAVDASGAVLITGTYSGTYDFDPGPGQLSHNAANQSGMLVKLSSTGTLLSARFYDNALCSANLSAVTVASDGNIWAVGNVSTGADCPLDTRTSNAYAAGSVLIVKHDPANTPLGKWLLGPSSNATGAGVAAGAGGAIYVSGTTGPVDFDLGPGVARRWVGANGGGFILKLDSNAGFRWVRTIVDGAVQALTPTPDGGVIAGGISGSQLVTRLTADGGAVWTFAPGGTSTSAQSLASGAGRFAIAGTSSGNVDMDPGPGIDLVFGDIDFVSRYSF